MNSGAVVAVVGGPPVLRGRHHLDDVALQRLDVEALERLRVVEVLAQRVGPRRVLVEHRQVELVRPPVLVRPAAGALRRRGGDGRVFALADAVGCRGLVTTRSLDLGVGLTGSWLASRSSLSWPSGGGWAQAFGAPAPVDDLGLVDLEARVVGRGQAGRVADRAVDVGDGAAGPAHDVVVVVADPRLVARHASRPAGCAAPGPRRSARAARRTPPGGTRRRSPARTTPMIESVSACGWACTADSTAIRGRVTRRPAPRSMRSSSDAVGTTSSLAQTLDSIKQEMTGSTSARRLSCVTQSGRSGPGRALCERRSVRRPPGHFRTPSFGPFIEVRPPVLAGPLARQHVPQAVQVVAAPDDQALAGP